MAEISKIDELTLIARSLAMDDTRAFGRLVDATREPLRRFLFNLTAGDASLADDLAQNTYIKAWTNLSSFRATSRFRTWLTSIAVNEFYSWMRSERTYEAIADDTADTLADTSSDHAHFTDTRIDAASAISRLSPVDRSLVLLFYMEDMPLRKICRMTGLTESNVKTRLHRARARMAQYLSSE